MFYGWWVVACVFVAQLFMVGFMSYTFPFVIVPVRAEFDATATQANLAMTASTIVGLWLPPLIGPLADRWSARWLMVIGILALALGLAGMSASGSMNQFIIVFAVFMSAANTLLGAITGPAIISRWFTTSRGKALGISAAGTSVGGLLLPLIVPEWIDAWGWRTTLQVLGGVSLAVTLPLLLFVLRDNPSDKGLEPEGMDAPPGDAPAMPQPTGVWTTGAILGSAKFWLIGITLGLLFMSYTSVLSNVGLYVENVGADASVGQRMISLIAIFGLIGKIAIGSLADRIGLRACLWLSLGLAALGIGVLAAEPGQWWMIAASVSMGLAVGGMLPVWSGMIAAAFGPANFGRAMGLQTPLIAVLVMPGFLIAGWSADSTGSYTTAFTIFVGGIIAAFLLLFSLKLGGDEAGG